MSGGGGTTTQSNAPPQYVQDQHQANLNIGNILADRPYQPYTGPRIADWTADQKAGFDATRGVAGAWQPAVNAATASVAGMLAAPAPTRTVSARSVFDQWHAANPNASDEQIRAFTRGLGYTGEFGQGGALKWLDENTVAQGTPQMQAATMDRGAVRDVSAQKFTDADLGAYMNPYTSQVIDTTLADLSRQNDQVNAATRARAAAAGAFGGSRAALMETENNRNYFDKVGQTTANLRNQAFLNAQNAIATDQNRALQAAGMNQNMDFSVGSLNTGNQQQANATNAGIQVDLGKFDAQQALAANAQRLAASQQLAGLGQLGQQLGGIDAAALLGIGQQQQGMNQANLDLAYQDFLRQQGYPVDQLQLRNGLLSGPIGSTTTSNTSTDNTGQLVGSGIGAAATIAAAFM